MSIPLQPISDFEVPDDFPVQPYLDIHRRVATTQSDSFERAEFFGAWTAVAYRYKACTDHDSLYTDSISRAGITPTYPDRYIQDEELFNFFYTGISTIESMCYGCYVLGFMIQPGGFPFSSDQDRRRVTPASTASAFAKTLPNAPITSALKWMLASSEYNEWETTRNILSHRTSPGRLISIGAGPTIVEWKTIGLVLDQLTTVSRRVWLVSMVGNVIEAAALLPI